MNHFFRRQPRLEQPAPAYNDCDLEAQLKNNHERATGDADARQNIVTGEWTATRDGETVPIELEGTP